jgi:hypothetical protein
MDKKGPEVKFHASVFINGGYRVVSLTPGLSCVLSASEGRDRTALYKAFTAALVVQLCIREDMNQLMQTLPSKTIMHELPYVSTLKAWKMEGDISFTINQLYPQSPYGRWLYNATLHNGQRILVKFTRSYSIELHSLCADKGNAPSILAFQQLPGGWYAVAMENLDNAVPINKCHVDTAGPKIRDLVLFFHDKGFVHGDLRAPNIICKETNVYLIDFDWGGKVDEVSYPTGNLNVQLTEGRDDASLKITKEDDLRVLGNTLAQ